jgi:hypothetical protein
MMKTARLAALFGSIVLGAGCSNDTHDTQDVPCTVLFGSPSASTGLSSEQCQPRCNCGGRDFEATVFDQQVINALESKRLLDPPSVPTEDPYLAEVPPTQDTNQVCAVVYEPGQRERYRLESFASTEAAKQANAIVTHHGACGTCSSLADLAVYAAIPDLSSPVRECAMKGLGSGDQATQECLLQLGFTPACAQTWTYNSKNTRTKCLADCLLLLTAPHQNEDGTLNKCLQCDEEESGPVFKAVAGRTRRNSGIASALCRPCDSVAAISHIY